MSNADQAMAQAIEHFQSGNVVAGMFDLAHAGGCARLDREHASGLAKSYPAHAIYTAMCEALWEHGEEPLADIVQRVHHKLAGKTAVSTEPKPKLSDAQETALYMLRNLGYRHDEVISLIESSEQDDGGQIVTSVLKQLDEGKAL